MKTVVSLLAVVGLVVCFSGCASLDKQRQLEMANRTLAAEKEQCELELQDARSVAGNLRTKVGSLENELVTKNGLVSNLQGENDRLETAFASAQRTLETMADRDIPQPAVITQAILPEALDSALKQFAGQYPSVVEYDPKWGTVKWKSDLLFALGSDVVKDSATEALQGFAEIMSSGAAAEFDAIVVGHTDNIRIARESTRKVHPTNWHLSVHRAISVANVLQKDGVPPTRIGVMGYGEYRPLLSNDSEQNRAKNRRVEIHIVPAGAIAAAPRMDTGPASASR
jgi:chemotaxis protein MotB